MTHIKATAKPAWPAFTVHYDKIKTLHLREMFARTPAVANGLWRKGLAFISRLLKEPHHRGDAAAALRLAEERGVAAWRDAMFRGERSISLKGVPPFIWRCGRPRDRSCGSTAMTSCPMFTQSSTIWANSPGGCAMGRGGTYRQAYQERRQCRHRRFLSRTEMAYLALRSFSDRSMIFRFVAMWTALLSMRRPAILMRARRCSS